MPYKRTYRKRSSRRRPAGGAGRATDSRIAKIAKRVVMRSSETKLHCDTTPAATMASDTAVAVYDLMQVGQGDTIDSRDGDQILAKSLQFRGVVTLTSGVSSVYRIMVFRIPDVNTFTAHLPGVYDCITPEFYANTLGVMYDRTFTIANTLAQAAGGADIRRVVDLKFNLKNRKVQYHDGSTANPTKGGIAIWAVSDRVAAGGTAPTFGFQSVLKFKDP